jgi:hypothetical protein
VELSGLRSIQNTILVGKDGPGATYNTVQDALDAVPATASLADPWTILVLPGVYQENLTIEKNAVCLCGLGGVILQPSVADATVLIQAGVGSTPEYCKIQNLRIENSNAGEECIKIVGSAGTTLGESGVYIENCQIVASGVGTYQLHAEAVNDVYLTGGTFSGSSPTSLVQTSQLHRFLWSGVDGAQLSQLDYDTGGVIPSQFGSSYTVSGLSAGDLQSTLTGGGFLEIDNCSTGDVVLLGDQAAIIRGSDIGDITCNNTFSATLISSSRGTAAGSGVLVEEINQGSVVFAASSSESVSFAVDTVDANYGVSLDYEMASLANVKLKAVGGFDIEFPAPQTGTVFWTVHRRI